MNRIGLALYLALCLALYLAIGATTAVAQENAPAGYGWRGNWTGLFPDARVPAQWSNISTGPVQGMKCTTTQPADGSDKDAVPITKGMVTTWLVIGPWTVPDADKDFDKEMIPDEARLAPKLGDTAGGATVGGGGPQSAPASAPALTWRYAEPTSDGVSFWGVNILPDKMKGERNMVGYATTCLYAPVAGKVRAIMEHVTGAKVYVNGKEVYRSQKGGMAVGSAYAQSRNRLAHVWPVGPSFEFDVQKGWNRLTIKLVAPNISQWNDLLFYLRLSDAPGTKYASKNILWMTPLPDRSNATPIVVGDKVFIASEPDEIICIDKNTGKVLWNAINDYFEATPQAERDANPAFKEKIEPLARQVKEETDIVKRAPLRKKLQEALLAVDKKKYPVKASGHLGGHFEIVGFSTTPVSDGKYVYVWTGTGVAACYDLDGKRQWIRRLPEGDELHYSASPAVIGGRLGVFFEHLYGLDARTGEIAWERKEVTKTCASLIAARIAGVDVIISQQGDVVRASDGKLLWKNPHTIVNDTGWAAPTVSGDVLYIPWFGIAQVYEEDFTGCAGDEWKPKEAVIGGITAGVPREKGDQGDPWTAGSVLIHNGLLYDTDIHSRYYVVDLKTKKRVGFKDLGLPGDSSYVALRMAASPTLVGKFIVIMDNQGHSVTLEPGAECNEISRNDLATQIARDYAITTQEYIGYSPPVADGKRMYIRGEKYLYCIGER
ncbi:MAG: PQQ-binding-like beta-propeller repeat protein [Phycisphaerae bacterium]